MHVANMQKVETKQENQKIVGEEEAPSTHKKCVDAEREVAMATGFSE